MRSCHGPRLRRFLNYADRCNDVVAGLLIVVVASFLGGTAIAGAILLAVMVAAAVTSVAGRSIAGRSAAAASATRAGFGAVAGVGAGVRPHRQARLRHR